jgi:hypothetical protein
MNRVKFPRFTTHRTENIHFVPLQITDRTPDAPPNVERTPSIAPINPTNTHHHTPHKPHRKHAQPRTPWPSSVGEHATTQTMAPRPKAESAAPRAGPLPAAELHPVARCRAAPLPEPRTPPPMASTDSRADEHTPTNICSVRKCPAPPPPQPGAPPPYLYPFSRIFWVFLAPEVVLLLAARDGGCFESLVSPASLRSLG